MIRIKSVENSSLAALAIDLTPMIDILFIVLVFFILTANPLKYALKVNLPSKGAEQASSLIIKDSLRITLFPDNKWALDNQEFTDWPATKLAFKAAAKKAPKSEIIIATARDVSVERLLELMVFLQQENLQAAQILMNKTISP
tara:strand:+ start:1455 stop:1883 length:429 start_codon:yes stop_codon:yes gene_type:complete